MSAPAHQRPPWAVGEACQLCGVDAWHKLQEAHVIARHPFTTYVCCGCFGEIMGPLAVAWCQGRVPPWDAEVTADDGT